MAVKSFAFDRSLTEQFIRFGFDLYFDDRQWIPPFKADLDHQLSEAFSFHKKPGNSCRHFLATSGSRVAGRISAMVNSDLRDRDGTPVGSLGFFECIRDYHVAAELLETSVLWLRDECGLQRIWGPMNFDIWHGYRFMTKGFDQKLFYGEPYNKPYYPEYFGCFGFAVKQEWDSLEIRGRRALEELLPRGEERYRRLLDLGYRFVPWDVKSLKSEMRKLHGFVTDSFSGFLGFTPISPEDFFNLYSGSRYCLLPRLAVFVYDEQNKPAGFAVALLEISDAVRSMKGNRHWLSRLWFLCRRSRADCVNFYIAGITMEEMAKKSGLGRAGYAYIVRRILDLGYDKMVQSLIVKNGPSHNFAGGHRHNIQREYALYELNL